MKDSFFFNFERKTWPIFGSIFKNLHGPKIELFPLRRVYAVKTMSHVLVGFGETHDLRGRTWII